MYRSCRWNPFRWSSAFLACTENAGLVSDWRHGAQTAGEKHTHVHDVVKHDERRALRLGLVPEPDLADGAVPPKEVVQVLARDRVVQVLHEQYAVRARRQV
jgi:hypothetical protein